MLSRCVFCVLSPSEIISLKLFSLERFAVTIRMQSFQFRSNSFIDHPSNKSLRVKFIYAKHNINSILRFCFHSETLHWVDDCVRRFDFNSCHSESKFKLKLSTSE